MNKMTQRSTATELMDDPDLPKSTLAEVFADINRVSRYLGGTRLTQKRLWHTLKVDRSKHYRIYDFGCGDGELLRKLTLFLRKKKCSFEMVGLDISEKALALAKRKSTAFPEISYARTDILSDSKVLPKCDILICALTLHHFGDAVIPLVLDRFVAVTRQEVIINDLKRSPWACRWFKIVGPLLLRTKIAKNDGMESIKSGFLPDEIELFAQKLHQVRHHVQWFPNFRFVWSMTQSAT